MIEKTLTIGGRNVRMRASAATPRYYRDKFERDIIRDMESLVDDMDAVMTDGGDVAIKNLRIFENVAYIMAWQADHTIPEDVGDWLDGFEMFDIYQAMPVIIQLWNQNEKTYSTSKKKKKRK